MPKCGVRSVNVQVSAVVHGYSQARTILTCDSISRTLDIISHVQWVRSFDSLFSGNADRGPQR